eukprot:1949798-Amphidinium_carterae.1
MLERETSIAPERCGYCFDLESVLANEDAEPKTATKLFGWRSILAFKDLHTVLKTIGHIRQGKEEPSLD